MEYQDIRTALQEADAIEIERLRLRQPHAWSQLQERLEGAGPALGWLDYASWKWAGAGLLSAAAAMVLVLAVFSNPATRVDLQSVNQPKVWATPFYSSEADADVIWLSGLPMAQEVSAR
ncbi:MAG: hypothetical protein AAGK14_06660 [Verrucomicrobiota bacterium]